MAYQNGTNRSCLKVNLKNNMYSKRVKKHRELIVKIAYKLFDMKMPTMAETLLLAAHEIGDSTILHSTPESSVLHGVVGLL